MNLSRCGTKICCPTQPHSKQKRTHSQKRSAKQRLLRLSPKILTAGAKASGSGGVAVSALEMAQNSVRYSWKRKEVDQKLQGIMANIFHNIDDAAKRYGFEGNYVVGANIAGFEKVVNAMNAQGIV